MHFLLLGIKQISWIKVYMNFLSFFALCYQPEVIFPKDRFGNKSLGKKNGITSKAYLRDMFRTVLINIELPRPTDHLNSTFWDGLQLMRNFGLFFCVLGIFLLIMSLVQFKIIAPSMFFTVVAIGGYFLYHKTQKMANERKYLFQHGEAITAIVTDHGRQFNMLKSARDYTIFVKNNLSNNKIKVIHRKKDLWTASPIGSEIIGFHKDGKYFFGEEIACQFQVPNNTN